MKRWAMWYWYYGTPKYELFEELDDAMRAIFYMFDNRHGAPVGVQGADGSWCDVDSDEYKELEAGILADQDEARRRGQEPVVVKPSRRVVVPWGGREVTIPGDDPEWLGA